MTTLTIEFRGVTENILNALIEKGYAKTKSEAIRFALLHLGQEMKLTEYSVHQRAEKYMEEEILSKFARLKKK